LKEILENQSNLTGNKEITIASTDLKNKKKIIKKENGLMTW
jgi:hypothetical protein